MEQRSLTAGVNPCVRYSLDGESTIHERVKSLQDEIAALRTASEEYLIEH
jgi:hypothetical protein